MRWYLTWHLMLICCSILTVYAEYTQYIVLVHGILSDEKGMLPTEQYIREYFGETVYIKNVQLGAGVSTSWYTMNHQIEWLKEELQRDPILAGQKIIMIAHSQGGLIARAFIEEYNVPQTRIFITMASPHCGVMGTPGKIDDRLFLLDSLETTLYTIMYSSYMQNNVSVAGYWRDTTHYQEYLQKSCFLPYYNNEINHPKSARYKQNICALEHMMLILASHEEVLEPRESAHFCFYPLGKSQSEDLIESIFDSVMFLKDKLGLKTLHDSGRLHFGIAYTNHTNIQEDRDNFVRNILPFLSM